MARCCPARDGGVGALARDERRRSPSSARALPARPRRRRGRGEQAPARDGAEAFVLSGSLKDARRIDASVYAAIAATPTPTLDRFMRRLSNAANHSRLSLAAAAVLAATGGAAGRRAARLGLLSIAATSSITNLVVKPLARRGRPEAHAHLIPVGRRLALPASRSLPSGHSAAAFAFATAVGQALPAAGPPLRVLAMLVGYSRVHTGVHYPGDVVAGAALGTVIAQASSAAVHHFEQAHPNEVMPQPGKRRDHHAHGSTRP